MLTADERETAMGRATSAGAYDTTTREEKASIAEEASGVRDPRCASHLVPKAQNRNLVRWLQKGVHYEPDSGALVLLIYSRMCSTGQTVG
jgi:hypothetical protein